MHGSVFRAFVCFHGTDTLQFAEPCKQAGELPDYKKANATITKLVDQTWKDDSMLLTPGAKQGLGCASIFLTDGGLPDRTAGLLRSKTLN